MISFKYFGLGFWDTFFQLQCSCFSVWRKAMTNFHPHSNTLEHFTFTQLKWDVAIDFNKFFYHYLLKQWQIRRPLNRILSNQIRTIDHNLKTFHNVPYYVEAIFRIWRMAATNFAGKPILFDWYSSGENRNSNKIWCRFSGKPIPSSSKTLLI